MNWRSPTLVQALIILSVVSHPAQSQTPASQPPYTIQANTHIVLTDVTVTDGHGNPVHGLPQSAFRIFDNNQPQGIASFEEHSGIPTATIVPASEPGVYSNDYLLHLPPSLNIVLIDIANISYADQMYLNYELTRFLSEQPEGQPLAIYLRAGSGCFLLQDFTSDRKLLLAAVHKAIPRLPPLGREYLSDLDTLHQIALSLSDLSGRKNVLWFSGGSTLFLIPDAIPLQNDAAWRALYDELDQERIAVYPIDARGLTTYSGPFMWSQHMAMNETAQATGGQAFYDNNGLKETAAHLLETDSSFYTLTYSPSKLRFDNKWHKVRVAVEGTSYHLSYRSGYFADGSLRSTDQPPKSRIHLLAHGQKLELPELSDHPIIFQASVLPASAPAVAGWTKASGSIPPVPLKKGTVPFSIRYTVPIDALTVRNVYGRHQIVFGIAAIALDRDGSPARRNAEQVTMTLEEEAFGRNPHASITLDEQLNLAKSDKFLDLSLWDVVTGRFGTIQVPLEVPKPSKHQESTGRQ